MGAKTATGPAKLRPYSFAREELKRAWSDLRGGNMSAGRAAASVGMGAFVGCLPLFGLHLPIVLLTALRYRLDGAVAYLAANISNPFFAPFLIAAEVGVGSWMLTGRAPDFGTGMAALEALSHFPLYLAVGSPVVAAAMALLLAAITFVGTVLKRRWFGVRARTPYRLPDNAPEWVKAAEEVAARYADPSGASAAERTRFHYVRIKLVLDPIARMIAGVAGDAARALGHVLDIGAGRGQTALLLVASGRAGSAYGVDWDGDKIDAARRAAEALASPLPARFARGDARTAPLEDADTVLLVDILHYFTLEEQDAILARAADVVRPGGRIIVREADTERGWRSTATWIEEKVFTALRFNRGERVAFRPAREIRAMLEARGFAVDILPAWGKTPFSNVMIVGTRPA